MSPRNCGSKFSLFLNNLRKGDHQSFLWILQSEKFYFTQASYFLLIGAFQEFLSLDFVSIEQKENVILALLTRKYNFEATIRNEVFFKRRISGIQINSFFHIGILLAYIRSDSLYLLSPKMIPYFPGLENGWLYTLGLLSIDFYLEDIPLCFLYYVAFNDHEKLQHLFNFPSYCDQNSLYSNNSLIFLNRISKFFLRDQETFMRRRERQILCAEIEKHIKRNPNVFVISSNLRHSK